MLRDTTSPKYLHFKKKYFDSPESLLEEYDMKDAPCLLA